MLRFRTKNFDDPFVMTNSESNPERGNKIEGNVCEHLAGIKILDVKRNLMFDVASNPTLHGSGNGSVSNMLLHGKFTESAVREGCSGNFEEEKKIVSFCECIVSFGHLILLRIPIRNYIKHVWIGSASFECKLWPKFWSMLWSWSKFAERCSFEQSSVFRKQA